MNEGLVEIYRAKLDEETAKQREKVSRGNCTTFEDYKSMCAAIKATERAKDIFAEAVAEYFRDDEITNNSEATDD